jgi:hypothetical protein
MKKKIVGILVCTLLIATIIPVAGKTIVDKNNVEKLSIPQTNPPQTCPIWTIQFDFDVEAASGALGNAGAEYANGFFYSTRWASNLIHEYTSSGVLSKQFSITGVSGLRDLAYCPVDGFFYGGSAAGTIWGMDFSTETLNVSLSGNFACRAIAYNDDLDAFYVSNWGDPVWVVNRSTGTIINQFNLTNTTSTYGFAYDNYCNGGGPYLWVFDQTAGGAVIYQWDLSLGSFTGVIHDVAADFPASAGIAGGLFFTTEFWPGKTTLGGLLQGTPDVMFCYELCDYLTPAICCNPINMHWIDIPPSSTVTGSFEVSNCGDPGSILTWSVYLWPVWMENPNPPVFTPSSGTIIGGDPPTTVTFTFTAPSTPLSNFVGPVVVKNTAYPTGYCNMSADLTTPKNKAVNYNFNLLSRLFERYENAFPILRQILGY